MTKAKFKKIRLECSASVRLIDLIESDLLDFSSKAADESLRQKIRSTLQNIRSTKKHLEIIAEESKNVQS